MLGLLRRRPAGRCLQHAIRTELEALERRFLLSGAAVQISAPNVVQGAGEFEIDAVLTDSSRINSAGFGPSNIAVTGPLGPLKVLGEHVFSSGAGTTFHVSYFVQSPGGVWDADANGSYAVAFQPGQVFDAAGQSADGPSIQFSAAGLQPLTGPMAVAFEPSSDFLVSVPGTTGRTLEVTYSDPIGINVSSINSDNLASFVGSLDVTLQSVNVLDGGKVVNASYFMGAPGGAFFASSNTGYHVAINPDNAVTNSGGQPVASGGVIALYEVEIDPFDSNFAFSGSSASGFVAQAIGHQSNGDIILAGLQGDTTAGDAQLVIERRFADGSLDTTFGTNGLTITPAGNNDAAFALTVENDDSILVAGTTQNHFLLAHFTANGVLDTAFGPNQTGKVTTTISQLASSEVAYSVAVAPDGTIVAAGGSDGAWAFARYSSTGSPLNSFEVPLPVAVGAASAAEGEVGQIAIESDGTIVAAGSDGGNVDVAEVDASGTLVPGFNNGQVEQLSGLAVRTNLSTGLDHSIGMALDESGRIVVANRTPADSADFAIERLNTDGIPDTSFGSNGNGVVTSDFGGDDDADSVTIQPGAQIVVSGTSTDSNGNVQVAVAAFNADGTIDTENLINGQQLSASGITPSAVVAPGTVIPGIDANGQGVTSVFGDASGDNVNIGSGEQTTSGGGTNAQSLKLPGIVPTLQADPLTSSASTYSFSVIYADNSPLSADPLQSTSAITVTHVATAAGGGQVTPATATVLQVVGAVVDTSGDGSPRTVTYTVAAPSGSWGGADNGTYAIRLNGRVITDTHGNHASEASIGSFNVAIPSAAGFSISGTVFNDQNDDGLQDAGEAGVAGVVVYADVNGSGDPSGQPQALTDASGNYSISGLAGNQTYDVREVFPTGFSQTVPAADAGREVSVTNASASGADFGVIAGTAPASLSGQVFNGLNGAPLSGVTVFLDTNSNGLLDGGEISNVTDGSGNYRLSNLSAGSFAVVELPPGGQTTAASSVNVNLTSGAALGPSFADVPAGAAAGTLAPNLTGTFLTSPPAFVISGAKGQLTLQINNTGTAAAKRSIKVTLFASSTQSLAGAHKIIDVPVRLNLKAPGVTKVKLNFKYPSGLLNGKYSILASIDSGNAVTEITKTDNLAVSSPVTITSAFVSLNSTLTAPAAIKSGKSAILTLNLANVGNVSATGTSLIQIFASSDQTLDDIDARIASFRARLNIKPSRTGVLRLKVKLNRGQLRAGSYFLIARIGASGLIPADTAIAQTQTSVS